MQYTNNRGGALPNTIFGLMIATSICVTMFTTNEMLDKLLAGQKRTSGLLSVKKYYQQGKCNEKCTHLCTKAQLPVFGDFFYCDEDLIKAKNMQLIPLLLILSSAFILMTILFHQLCVKKRKVQRKFLIRDASHFL